MTYSNLPTLNAILNVSSATLLILGLLAIRRKRTLDHKRLMLSAFCVSGLFLLFYLTYHYRFGSTPYPHQDWTRAIYFLILVPHIILAAVMVPFIFVLLWQAIHENFEKHKKVARWIWPVWMYVSVSGVLVYLMLYHF